MKLELRISVMMLRLLNAILWHLLDLNPTAPTGVDHAHIISESQNLISDITGTK